MSARRSKILSPSRFRNFIYKNTLEDWLALFGKRAGYQPNKRDFTPTYMRLGDKFEQKVYDCMCERFGLANVVGPICKGGIGTNSKANFRQTKQYMKAGVHVIYQAMMRSQRDQTQGIADFLVRSDKIDQIFDDYSYPLVNKATASWGQPWHYVVIDAKFAKLQLCSDGYKVRNTEFTKFTKLQLYIYNRALEEMQGYLPQYAFILAAGFRYQTQKNGTITKIISNNAFDRPGVVNFAQGHWDDNIRQCFDEGKKWLKRLYSKEAHDWRPLPEASIEELCANLKSKSHSRWTPIVQQIGAEQDDLTKLWSVTESHRTRAYRAGIKRCRHLIESDEPEVHLKEMGFQPTDKRARTLTTIIQRNKSEAPVVPSLNYNQQRLFNGWQDGLFLDFEYLVGDHVPGCDVKFSTNTGELVTTINDHLYLSGIYNAQTNIYHSFSTKQLNYRSESNAVIDMLNFLNQPQYKQQKIFHWSKAEVEQLKRLQREQPKLSPLITPILKRMVDLHQIFLSNRLVVKGMLDFSLKSVVSALYNHQLIDSNYSQLDCNDAELASEIVKSLYNCPDLRTNHNYQKVISYNQMDCKVMWAICKVLLTKTV